MWSMYLISGGSAFSLDAELQPIWHRFGAVEAFSLLIGLPSAAPEALNCILNSWRWVVKKILFEFPSVCLREEILNRI